MDKLLESAIASVSDVISALRPINDRGRFGPDDFTTVAEAVTMLRAADRLLTEAYKTPRGQCRAEHAYDEGIGAPGRSRCELDAGHDGAHEDGDWGWSE